MDFAGDGVPLSRAGIATATNKLGVTPAALWAVVRVETRGCGFLPDRRPVILFERHVFHRETGGRFDSIASDISDSSPGGYGAAGAYQYDRLSAAIALDRGAALRSASWGIGQVMGFHTKSLGYADVEAMVALMIASEDDQLHAMTTFIANAGLHHPLQEGDWASFARGYNGADFARNRYDAKLQSEFQMLTSRGLPDLRIRSAQVYLTYCGLDPGPIDGVMGDRTRKAVRSFQERAGFAVTGDLDDATLARLAAR